MTEFALVLPILAMLLFGVIQFGIVFNNYLQLTDAVRAGSRQGAVSRRLQDPEAAVIDRVEKAATGLKFGPSDISVSSKWQQGSEVSVTASYRYKINLLGVVVKSGWMTSRTKERVE